jgi:hypothetical protein
MKVELTFPDELADLIAEKVVEMIKPLLEERVPEPRTSFQANKEIDPMMAMTERETALLVGKSVSTLRNDRCLGRGVAYFKIGKTVRYRRIEVLKWLESQRVEPRS